MFDLIISTLTQGFIYALLSYGIYITYKILDFPDLTVDGSFPLGAAITAVLLVKGMNPFLVLVAALLVGAAAGLVPGLIYKALESKNRWAATICAAVAAPIVNTGIFLLGCLAFFMDTISEWAAGAGVENAGVYMVTAFVGVNFLVELGANLLLSSVIVRIVDIVKNKLSSNKQGL